MKKLFIFALSLTACYDNSKNANTEDKNIIVTENIKISDIKAKELFMKGLNLVESKDNLAAKQYFIEANEIEKNNPIILNSLVTSKIQMGDTLRATEMFNKIISLDSNYVLVYVNYGNFLNHSTNYSEAIKILSLGFKFDPSEQSKTALYYNLAIAYESSGNCEQAISCASQAIIYAPDLGQKDDITAFKERIMNRCRK